MTEDDETITKPEFFGTFGCILPLTGNYSKLGEMAIKGVRTAVENAGQYGEYKILIKDSMSTKEGAYIAYNQILSESNPLFIVGPLPSNHITDIEGKSNYHHVPVVIFPVFDRKNSRKNIHSYYLPINSQIRTLADYSLKDLKLKNFAILSPQTSVGSNISRSFKNYLKKKGGKIVYDGRYEADLNDIDVHVQWLQAYKLDAVFIPDGAENSSYVIKKIISDDDIANVIFLGPNTWNSKIFYELSKNYFDGVLYKIIFTDFINTKSRDWTKFTNLYFSLYNEWPNTFQFQIYSATLYFLEKDLKKRNIEELKLISEDISLEPRTMIFTIENGNVLKLK
ncbi:MAG: ABC transporter substrate-binding protein [Thermodesulfobacteriota bacterium]